MMLTVSDIVALPGLPNTPMGARKWLARQGIKTALRGKRFEFSLADLPEEVRRALAERHVVEAELPPGDYDDEAHARLAAAPATVRALAERKAGIVYLLKSLPAGTSWADRLALVRKRFGAKGVSKATLRRYLKAVEGVAPVNYAPALLADFTKGPPPKDISAEAWAYFLTTIRDAGPEFPLIQAWRDVRDVGAKRRWAWPSYPTITRRWAALPEVERVTLRRGAEATAKRLAAPAMRDKTSLGALEEVSLDGRTLDVFADFGDGRAVRPTMLVLVDVASGKVLGWELAPSENAVATVRLIKRACARYGIIDRLYTDNGSAFAGHLVAGGNVHRFRNAGSTAMQPPGICQQLRIELRFALPGNAQAKLAERTFAALSRSVDDRPEFAGAHAGHCPGETPAKPVLVPVEMLRAVIDREVARYNAEPGRRSQGARSRSYDQVFDELLARRVPRVMTARQEWLAGLFYKPAAVDRWGRVTLNGWTYGDHGTQDVLIRWHGKQPLLIGRDPEDFSQPAIAYARDGDGYRLVCEGIKPVKRHAYTSVEGIREAARNRKAIRAASKAALATGRFLSDAEMRAAWAELGTPEGAPEPPRKVVGARFGSPLGGTPEPYRIPEEFLRNEEAVIRQMKAERG
jgi:putative transposase